MACCCSRGSASGSSMVARDARDDVGAVGLLAVEHRVHRGRGAGGQVEQGGDDGGGAEVEGDRVAGAGGVAVLDVDQQLVDDDRRDLEVAAPQHLRQPAQRVQRGTYVEVVDRLGQPGEVGPLVVQRRLGELDVALLHGRPQDHLPADTDGGGLGPGGQRRHLDLQVLHRRDPAGEPPAVAQLLVVERTRVQPGDRRGVVGDADLALLAGAVPATGGVDRDAVPAGRVEHGHARRHGDVAIGRTEAQVHPAGAVVRGRLGAGRRGQRVDAAFAAEAVDALGRGDRCLAGHVSPPVPVWLGARRSSRSPTRRGRAAGRRRVRPRRSAACGRP